MKSLCLFLLLIFVCACSSPAKRTETDCAVQNPLQVWMKSKGQRSETRRDVLQSDTLVESSDAFLVGAFKEACSAKSAAISYDSTAYALLRNPATNTNVWISRAARFDVRGHSVNVDRRTREGALSILRDLFESSEEDD